MEINHQASAESLLQETNCLITLPEVCMKLRQTLDDPNHTRQEISDVIVHDPSLTARLLRIVNSAYFGLSTPVTCISHALGILGEQDLNNLVIVTSIVKTMNSINTELDRNAFWRSSIFAAIVSRNIAATCQSNLKEELFIAGLLLNIGQFLIYYREPELLEAVEKEKSNSNRSDFSVEKEFLGFSHADVGSAMARNWNFSELLIRSISSHHEIEEIDSNCLAGKITYLAARCCERINFKTQQDTDINELEADLQELLEKLDFKFKPKQFSEILHNSFDDYIEAYEDFCGAKA